jgi:class 3 adenylate cyclase/tetratricopeptide (TPR) repeat protein
VPISIRCTQCDSVTSLGSRFCPNCGAGVESICAACGHAVQTATGFCTWCGVSQQPRWDGPAGEERKQATVLFADIVGSTNFIAGLDAEGALNRLRPVVAAMAQAVRRCNGTVLRWLGDGLKASFGAPLAQEGHALLACKAALAIREAVSALPGSPAIRIGLHSGEVVTGNFDIGSAVGHDAIGMTVHVAHRIEQFAQTGSICLSQECRQLVLGFCDTVPLGLHIAKGVAEPIELHRLIGLKPAIASEQFRGTELARMHGRDLEFTQLQLALAAAEQGDTSVIGIAAPPGLGKSRLCYEFSEWCRRRSVNVLEARVLIYAFATPLQPVLEMLRSFFRLSPLDDAHATREAIARRLTALGLELEADLPLLADFLSAGGSKPAVAGIDPRVRHAQLREAVQRIVRAVGRAPGVIIIEDLHWLDPPSEDFMETLVEAVVGTRTLLILNFRPTYRAPWMDRPHYRELVLPELGTSDIQNLVRELTGGAPALAELRAQIADRSGGNPFFAQELVRSLADRGALVGERGNYREGPLRDVANLPATVDAVLGARIDRLPEREKMLLQVGAIVGKDFPLVVVQAILAIPELEIEKLLAHLCDLGLVHEQTTVAGRSFAFRHPLIQEVAYEMQLRTRRTALHDTVAKTIEQFEWGRLDETAGLLAHHYEAAGDQLNAAIRLQRAAHWLGRSNSGEAYRSWKKVRNLLQDVPRSETNDRMRALASGQILSFGWREGMPADEAKPYADEALHYARAGGDDMHPPLLLGAYGRILAATGAADDYTAVVQEALTLTTREGDAGRTATVTGMLVQAHCFAGRLHEALAANDAALATIAAQQDMDRHVALGLTANQLLGFNIEQWIKCYRTLILVRLGRFEEAEHWLAVVTQIDPNHVDYVVQFIPHVAQVELAWWRQDPRAAALHADLVVEYATKAKAPYLRSYGTVATALARSTAGDFTGAAGILHRGLVLARQAPAGRELEPRILAELAGAQFEAGDIAAAAVTAAEAISVGRHRTHRICEAHACMTRARALLRTGTAAPGEDPKALLRRAEHLIEISGVRVLDRLLATTQMEVEAARQ